MESLKHYQKHRILMVGLNLKNEYTDTDRVYKKTNTVTKILKKIHNHLPLPYKEFWYGNWKNNVKKYDVIILFAGTQGNDIIKYIKKENPTVRIIVYYMNTFKNGAKNDPANFINLDCELWSFDKNDCQKTTMMYSHYFYDVYNIFVQNSNSNTKEKYDAFFIGLDKERLADLIDLKDTLEKYHYKCKFIVKKTRNKTYLPENRVELTEQRIPYENIVHLIDQSRCIIDIVQNGQIGLTLRPMEAIFFRKKLITNNIDIMNYDFYCSENIFVLGVDSEKKLETFLFIPYKELDEKIVKQYTFECWLERFFVND